tara:strand:+ start:7635 stop:8438 length:804 start_codon:yes stop_codon:yes gene_type:complete
MKYFLLNFDVDYVKGTEKVFPLLFEYLNKKKINSSFFITGYFARDYPQIIKDIQSQNHDLGAHGLNHGFDPTEDFSINDYNYCYKKIKYAHELISDASGIDEPRIFRAPNLWSSQASVDALIDLGYSVDSSIGARRLLGRVKNVSHFTSSLNPYYIKSSRGNLENIILEIPPSASLLAFNLSSLRMFGSYFMYFLSVLYYKKYNFINFYAHPAEFQHFHEVQYGHDIPSRHKNTGPNSFILLNNYLSLLKNKFTIKFESIKKFSETA